MPSTHYDDKHILEQLYGDGIQWLSDTEKSESQRQYRVFIQKNRGDKVRAFQSKLSQRNLTRFKDLVKLSPYTPNSQTVVEEDLIKWGFKNLNPTHNVYKLDFKNAFGSIKYDGIFAHPTLHEDVKYEYANRSFITTCQNLRFMLTSGFLPGNSLDRHMFRSLIEHYIIDKIMCPVDNALFIQAYVDDFYIMCNDETFKNVKTQIEFLGKYLGLSLNESKQKQFTFEQFCAEGRSRTNQYFQPQEPNQCSTPVVQFEDIRPKEVKCAAQLNSDDEDREMEKQTMFKKWVQEHNDKETAKRDPSPPKQEVITSRFPSVTHKPCTTIRFDEIYLQYTSLYVQQFTPTVEELTSLTTSFNNMSLERKQHFSNVPYEMAKRGGLIDFGTTVNILNTDPLELLFISMCIQANAQMRIRKDNGKELQK